MPIRAQTIYLAGATQPPPKESCVDYPYLLAGLTGLFLGGEFLVRGSVGIARRMAIPPLLIGLTVVGFGTSTPELLVSVKAAWRGVPDIALGNIVGSNIANILLIVGLSALVWPTTVIGATLRRDTAVMMAATLVLVPIFAMGQVGRLATSLIAALRSQSEIAIGNIVGSNIFNLPGILGVTALITPIPVASRFPSFDLPVLIAVSLVLCALLVTRPVIGRGVGVAMLAGHAAYIRAGQGGDRPRACPWPWRQTRKFKIFFDGIFRKFGWSA